MFHPIILGIQPLVVGGCILGKFEGWHRLTIAIDDSMPKKLCTDGIVFEDCLVPHHLQCAIILTTMFHHLTHVKNLIP